MSTDAPPPILVSRSSFVTTVAWVFIVLASFGTVISVLQSIVIYTLFPFDQMHAAMAQAREKEEMPAFTLFMFEHIRELFTGFLIVTSGTLIISIGLLKRWNWARMLFISLLALGIVWNLGGLVWQWFFFRLLQQQPQANPMGAQFQTLAIAMGIVLALIAIGTAVLFAWIIKRLSSPAIKSEFMTGSTQAP